MSGRRMGYKRFKGPSFKSYQTAQLDTTEKMQWLPHTGTRAQLRNLRHKCRHLLDSQDEEVKLMARHVIEAVKDEPNPEFGALHLICAALDRSFDSGETWLTCMQYLLDKFEEHQHAQLPDHG